MGKVVWSQREEGREIPDKNIGKGEMGVGLPLRGVFSGRKSEPPEEPR